MENQKPRIRMNAKQTAKGLWQLDVTVETYNGENTADLLICNIKNLEFEMKDSGKELTG